MAIVETIKAPRTNDPKEIDRFFREVAKRLSYIQSDGSPAGAILPRWIGDLCFDATNTEWYRSTGTANTDWEVTT
jgi:hypothetical protein